jgi:hypothetical protein
VVVAEGVAGPGRDLDVDSYVSISNLDARKTVLSAGPERAGGRLTTHPVREVGARPRGRVGWGEGVHSPRMALRPHVFVEQKRSGRRSAAGSRVGDSVRKRLHEPGHNSATATSFSLNENDRGRLLVGSKCDQIQTADATLLPVVFFVWLGPHHQGNGRSGSCGGSAPDFGKGMAYFPRYDSVFEIVVLFAIRISISPEGF